MANEEKSEARAETEEGQTGSPKPPGKKSIRTILIAGGAALLVLSNGFFIYRSFASRPSGVAAESAPVPGASGEGEVAAGQAKKSDETKASELLDEAAVLPLQPFLVNLADSGVNRFLRARIELVFPNREAMERIQKNEFAVSKAQDVALGLLAAKTTDDVVGPEGRARLRKELASAIGEALEGTKIVDVLLTDFIIQY
jgi:flagellar protein FliL